MSDFDALPDVIPVTMNGRWTLNLPRHRARQWANPWEKVRLEHMAVNVRPGDVVLDCGAESADMSALYASWAGPDGGVILVEPSAHYWPCIRRTFEANGLECPIVSFAGFAAAEDATGDRPQEEWPFRIHRWPDEAFAEVPLDREGFATHWERPDLPSISVDSLTEAWDVHVIAMDIEGAELLALRGAETLLTEQRPLVYLSVHPDEFMAPYGYTQADLWAFVEWVGYERRLLAEEHELHFLLSHPEGREAVEP